MQSIYDPATLQEITSRINKLTLESQREWGKMTVDQMLAHCCEPLEVSLGDKTMHPPFIMKLFAPFIKGSVVNEKPFKPGLPTPKEFIVVDKRNFNFEKARLIALVSRVSNTSPDVLENRRHPFFGKMTAKEWSNATVKHLDHHLKQFGA